MRSSQLRFILLAVALATLFVILLLSKTHLSATTLFTPSYIENQKVKPKEAYAHWNDAIARLGSEEAHAELLRVGATLPIWEAHALAHTFGDALFERMGQTGLYVCGDEFLAGCEHEFIERVIAAYGLSGIDSTYAACKKHPDQYVFGCEHGIGHGLVGYFGYTLEDLKQALNKCDTLEIPFRWNGCYQGAFMEFESRSLAGDKTILPRQVTDESKLTPCLSVPTTYRELCARDLPTWWDMWNTSSDAPSSAESLFSTMGNWCESLPNTTLIHACFIGIGSEIVRREASESAYIPLCNASTNDTLNNVYCRSTVARVMFIANPSLEPEDSCKKMGLVDKDLIYCTERMSTRVRFNELLDYK